MKKYIMLILCLTILAGCAPSMVHRQNLLKAIKDRTDVTRYYTKGVALDELGFPSSRIASVWHGEKAEIWTYKTNLSNKFLLINTHPVQTRYLKITFIGDKSVDYSYE